MLLVVFGIDYKLLSPIQAQVMSKVTLITNDLVPQFHVNLPNPVFLDAGTGDMVRRWGPIFAVFGTDMDAVAASLQEAGLGGEDVREQLESASRRYGALLCLMSLDVAATMRPCILYDCCEGFTVMLLRQTQRNDELADMASGFDETATSVNEDVFLSVLSRAIQSYFEQNAKNPLEMVTVAYGGADYVFMRTSERDAIFGKLHLSSPSVLF